MSKSVYTYDNMLQYEYILNEFYKIKKNCRNSKMIYNFELYLHQNLLRILRKLYVGKYTFNSYYIFIIQEPKYRIIMSETLADKLVNHLVSDYILLPNLESKLIDTNVATRLNKGTGYAFNILYKYLNKLSLPSKEIFVLKIDIKKYFYSIDHKILFSMLKKYIRDPKTIKIIKTIIDSTNDVYLNKKISKLKLNEINKVYRKKINDNQKDILVETINALPTYTKNKGLPIGNMTSQILAIFFLNDIDHFIKEKLKCKYYIRYMDDLVILDYDYNKLKEIFRILTNKIEELNLEVNKKSNIYKLSEGFSFLGYTFRIRNGLIIKSTNQTYYRIKRHLNNLKKYDKEKYGRSLSSYKGYFSKCNISSKKPYKTSKKYESKKEKVESS